MTCPMASTLMPLSLSTRTPGASFFAFLQRLSSRVCPASLTGGWHALPCSTSRKLAAHGCGQRTLFSPRRPRGVRSLPGWGRNRGGNFWKIVRGAAPPWRCLMVSTRDTLIQHNGFSGQAIFEEPGPVAKRAVLGPELLVQSPAPRVHAEDCDVAYRAVLGLLQASLSALCALTTGSVCWPPWSFIVAAAHLCLDVCFCARAYQWKMICEINSVFIKNTRNLLLRMRSHQHTDESARRETRRPYAQSEVRVQVEDYKNVCACVSARALAYVQVCVCTCVRARAAQRCAAHAKR